MKHYVIFLFFLFFLACKSKEEKIFPSYASIAESVYASGIVKAKNQYQVFSTVNGIVETIYVQEGDYVKKGDPILSISNDVQRFNRDNAKLSAVYADESSNQGKLNEAKLAIDFAMQKMKIDSSNFARQMALWQNNIGSKVELEQRELAYKNARLTYESALVKYQDLQRLIDVNAAQSKNTLRASETMQGDYVIKAHADGMVYSISKEIGELVTIQSPIAIIGDDKEFVLEMLIDEADILTIKDSLLVLLTLESYKNTVFKARVSKINPIMNERTKAFTIEAVFEEKPSVLYPNLTFEANIVLRSKDKALLIPREYLIDEQYVLNAKNEKIEVKTGLKDYKKVEILDGISEKDALSKPVL